MLSVNKTVNSIHSSDSIGRIIPCHSRRNTYIINDTIYELALPCTTSVSPRSRQLKLGINSIKGGTVRLAISFFPRSISRGPCSPCLLRPQSDRNSQETCRPVSSRGRGKKLVCTVSSRRWTKRRVLSPPQP